MRPPFRRITANPNNIPTTIGTECFGSVFINEVFLTYLNNLHDKINELEKQLENKK